MKKLIYFAFAAAPILLLAACAKDSQKDLMETVKEVTSSEPEGAIVTLSALIDEDGTKGSISEQGVFLWEDTDKISVWISNGASGKFKQFTLSSGAGKKNAVFTGTVDSGYHIEGPAVFPYNDSHAFSYPTLTFNQPQTLDIPNQGNRVPMLANYDSGTGSLSFRHLDGLMSVTMYNVPSSAEYARLTTTGIKNNGTFSVDISVATPVLEVAGTEVEERTRLNAKITPEDAVGNIVVVKFPMPVGDYTSFNVTPRNSSWGTFSGCEINTTKSQKITRGKIKIMPEVTFNKIDLADNENGLRENFNKVDYNGSAYTGDLTTDATLEIIDNPKETATNASSKVLQVTSTPAGGNSGLIDILTKGAFDTAPTNYYPTGYRTGTKAFTVKMLYSNTEDKTKYYPRAVCKSTQSEFGLPDRINGEAFDGTSGEWDRLVKADDWNVLQWTCNTSGVYRIDIKPFVALDGANATSTSGRIMYFDDFRLLK